MEKGESRTVEKQVMSQKHWEVLEPLQLLAELNPSKLLMSSMISYGRT